MRPGRPIEISLGGPRSQSDAVLPVRRAYCVGMAGSGMQAIAEWLIASGWHVSGSDRSSTPQLIERFRQLGATLGQTHEAEQLPRPLDWLIYSPAVSEDNPERRLASEVGVPQSSYPQALGLAMRGTSGISIAGTHGKSTTTALVGHILKTAGSDPSVLCGARMRNYDRSGIAGTGELLIAESCEYRGHFLELSPRCIGLLGIEADHFDCFPSLESAVATYSEFVSRLPAGGMLVANSDCEATRRIAIDCGVKTVWVSTTDDAADYLVTRVSTSPAGLRLSIRLPDRRSIDLNCSLSGNHHATNLATAVAIALEHGATVEDCQTAIASFEGISRRFEVRQGASGMTWVDDYAHHPTALRAVIDAARDRFPDRRVCCVFQPHQVSRTRELAVDFVQSLRRADEVLVLPVFGAREAAESERIALSRQLAREVSDQGVPAQLVGDLDHLWSTLETHLRPGDVVLTIGAGDIDRIYHEFTGRLRRHYAS